MAGHGEEVARRRMETALALHDDGVAMMRLTLRRRHPEAPADQVESMLAAWLGTRPGAEHGDAVGTPRTVR